MNYERLDTGVGVLIEVIGALVLMAACAFGLAHTKAFGNFSDLSATAADLQRYVGHGTGYLLALATLDGSLIGANLTALTTTYTLGDVYPKMRHSLHWKLRQAPWFYGLYAVLVGLSAVVTLAWGNDLGVVIDGVEALNGILLPSALVFLILLANDKPVLGPWANSTAQNWVGGVIAWAVLTFSLAPLVTTFFPNVTLTQCHLCLRCLHGRRAGGRRRAAAGAAACPGGSPRPGQPGSRQRPAAARDEPRRMAPRCSASAAPRGARRRLDTLQRPALSMARRIGLLTLRGYIVFAIVIMVIKLVQVTAGH